MKGVPGDVDSAKFKIKAANVKDFLIARLIRISFSPLRSLQEKEKLKWLNADLVAITSNFQPH